MPPCSFLIIDFPQCYLDLITPSSQLVLLNFNPNARYWLRAGASLVRKAKW